MVGKMTAAQKRFFESSPWTDDCLTGSERAMARRLVDAGYMVEVRLTRWGKIADLGVEHGYAKRCKRTEKCGLHKGHHGECGVKD